MQVRMTQHPVGQGGLSTGEAETAGGCFRWAYDCGSNQDDALVREIKRAAHPGVRDVLFLSHLDSDHVSGVDRLLAQCAVDEVVLPYLAEDLIIAVAAGDCMRGRLSGLFLDAVPDVAGWFASRGVGTVTFVRGDERDEGPDEGGGPILPDPGEGPEETIVAKWSEPPESLGMRPRAGRTVPASAPLQTEVRQVSPRAALTLRAGMKSLNWVLIPYVHQPRAQLLDNFRTALVAAFGDPLDVHDIAAEARTKVGRDKLRGCYDELWRDHNLVSMTLYSGPLRAEPLTFQNSAPDRWFAAGPGWMLSGDAHLDGLRRRKAFLRHYRAIAEFVGALMLPHHGSIHNFDDELLTAFPRLEAAFACAGPNDYGHPHPAVRGAVEAAGVSYHQVSHQPRSRLSTIVRLG
jgi:hypothetical protein